MIVAELMAKLGLVPDEKSWDKGHELIESLHSALEVYLGYEGLKKVQELVEGTVEAASQAKNLAIQLGVSTDAVQELGYAANIADISTGELTGAMRKLSVGLETVKEKGSGPTADALRKLGVSMKDLKGESLDQNLEVLADAFEKAGPKVNKTQVAIDLFGRSAGPKMLQLMEQGSAGIVQLRNEAHELGVVLDEDALEKADELEESQKRMTATMTGLRNTIAIAVIPAITEMAKGLQKWIAENREAIASTLKAVLEGIVVTFKVLGTVLGGTIKFFQEHHELFGALLVAVALFAAESVAAAIASAIAWTIAFLPVIIGIAAITLLVLVIKKLIEYITGKKMSWTEMWDAAIEGGKELADWFAALPDRVETWVNDVAQSIKDAFGDAWDYVVKTAKDAWSDVEDIPVFGDIVKGTEWVNKHIGVQAQIDAATSALSPDTSVPVPGGGEGGTVENNFGDTHIQIDASGMSPDELHAAVKDSVREAHEDAVRAAYSAVSGGKR